MKRIIVPTGYMGSGSSAVTDLISEYKDCSNEYKSFEYVFLHCPNGIFDLEDKLLLGNNALRSDEAIRTFEKTMNELYDKKYWWVGNYKEVIGKSFKEYTSGYINKLINFKVNDYWYMHEKVNFLMFLKLVIKKILKVISFKKFKGKKVLRYNDGMKICMLTNDKFYKLTSQYIYKIIDCISKGKENVVLDQLLLPHNLYRIDNYFNAELKVIVVERDPRDVFILNKYIWPKKNCQVPFPTDVKDFCKYYDLMRRMEKKSDSNKILRIKFEDLIYNYEATVAQIEKFVGFNNKDHIFPKSRFNPEISIKNTQVFNLSEFVEETKVIDKELKKYLYKFPYKLENKLENTIEFE